MSTDKLQALHNTVAEILSAPPSPPSFFDEEPYDTAHASEQVARTSENLGPGTEISKEQLGKATSREIGISPNEIPEAAHIVRGATNDSPRMVRQARSDPQTASINSFRQAVPGERISLGGWALRGLAGILLAAGIGVAGLLWLGSSGDALKTAPSPPAALAQNTAAAAATPPELTPLLQSMARDLASMGKEIEQLKAGRDLMARDNANSEQLKASQEQLTRTVARLSEQLKASQEQAARDNANVAEQIRGIQEQLTSVISRASGQNAPPKMAATPPRPATPAARQPGPILLSPQATAQPKAEKPKLSSTSRPPPPAR